ncbi:MAG TPA: hypothetical protein VMF06_06060, partial [Candidatus Limnocylindria bacterium]|nr:hypothetical protein [Candidatus Limnocylindria bacterium]
TFRFEGELFDHRATALEVLDGAGYNPFTDFSSVDLLHDLYGLEICGIRDPNDAHTIKASLCRTFPGRRYFYVIYKHVGRDVGWKFVIHRDREHRDNQGLEA